MTEDITETIRIASGRYRVYTPEGSYIVYREKGGQARPWSVTPEFGDGSADTKTGFRTKQAAMSWILTHHQDSDEEESEQDEPTETHYTRRTTPRVSNSQLAFDIQLALEVALDHLYWAREYWNSDSNYQRRKGYV